MLLGILKNREQIVKERLRESLLNFGKEEKILIGSADFRKDNESMPDILRKLYQHDANEIDRILGLNEQLQTVDLYRNIPPEEKLYQWLTGSADFSAERNWNENILAYASTQQFDHKRE